MASSLPAFMLLILFLHHSEAWIFSSSSSSRGGGSRATRPHDIGSQSGLTALYNTRVTHVDQVRRPLGSGGLMAGVFSHSGVVVTTGNGRKWLIHTGDGYGGSGGQTVVTDARHMSRRWRNRGGHDVTGSRVGDFVQVGGRDYSLCTDNCHHGRNRMLDLP